MGSIIFLFLFVFSLPQSSHFTLRVCYLIEGVIIIFSAFSPFYILNYKPILLVFSNFLILFGYLSPYSMFFELLPFCFCRIAPFNRFCFFCRSRVDKLPQLLFVWKKSLFLFYILMISFLNRIFLGDSCCLSVFCEWHSTLSRPLGFLSEIYRRPNGSFMYVFIAFSLSSYKFFFLLIFDNFNVIGLVKDL